jgi:ubiquinone/menaquinone biosynthesis C-methylase UbiE
VRAYYDRRATEYDDWYLALGRFDALDRPQWDNELHALEATIADLPPARTLDVACGTGFLTRHLPGEITGLDASAAMLEIARERVPDGEFVQADALELPFEDGSFERVFTGHFYGHLVDEARVQFLDEARRVGEELVVVDTALQPDHEPIEWQERVLNDGSHHRVYKRYFSAEGLAEELGGGEVLHAGRYFVAVRAPR